jgi:hypothetical protein
MHLYTFDTCKMSKVQQYADYSNGKNCFVCDSSDNVRSMAVYSDDVSYVGPVCQIKTCRRDARDNVGGVVDAAKTADKLMETHFHKM